MLTIRQGFVFCYFTLSLKASHIFSYITKSSSLGWHDLHCQLLLPADNGERYRLVNRPLSQEAMQIVNARHCLFIDGHDQIAFSQARLSGRTVGFNRRDLDRSFIGQIVEAHQATSRAMKDQEMSV